MRVLLTNDDGVDSPGLDALRDALSTLGKVTVVAPATDQSGVGRARSRTVGITDHDDAIAVAGTPADCVAYGLRGLDHEFDLVVSGCNHGPSIGAYVLGRSGTVGAAMEAGFLGVPAVAVSAYHPDEFFPTRHRRSTSRGRPTSPADWSRPPVGPTCSTPSTC